MREIHAMANINMAGWSVPPAHQRTCPSPPTRSHLLMWSPKAREGKAMLRSPKPEISANISPGCNGEGTWEIWDQAFRKVLWMCFSITQVLCVPCNLFMNTYDVPPGSLYSPSIHVALERRSACPKPCEMGAWWVCGVRLPPLELCSHIPNRGHVIHQEPFQNTGPKTKTSLSVKNF